MKLIQEIQDLGVLRSRKNLLFVGYRPNIQKTWMLLFWIAFLVCAILESDIDRNNQGTYIKIGGFFSAILGAVGLGVLVGYIARFPKIRALSLLNLSIGQSINLFVKVDAQGISWGIEGITESFCAWSVAKISRNPRGGFRVRLEDFALDIYPEYAQGSDPEEFARVAAHHAGG